VLFWPDLVWAQYKEKWPGFQGSRAKVRERNQAYKSACPPPREDRHRVGDPWLLLLISTDNELIMVNSDIF
jgi:hypothetical protein